MPPSLNVFDIEGPIIHSKRSSPTSMNFVLLGDEAAAIETVKLYARSVFWER
jgi:hypothetical protein